MTHILRLPFITENPKKLDANQSILVRRLCFVKPGVLGVQGRPVGSVARPVTWEAGEHDIANLLYTYTVGYRGMLHLPGLQDIWTELAAKIDNDRRRT